MPPKPSRLSIKELADLCLQHLAQNPEQLAEFMIQSGIGPSDLRGIVGTQGLAHGLIDYVVSNEPLLLAVAAQNQLKPESIVSTWAGLHHTEH